MEKYSRHLLITPRSSHFDKTDFKQNSLKAATHHCLSYALSFRLREVPSDSIQDPQCG